MKTNELMVGDWVKVTDDDIDDSFIGQVKAIDELENINVPEGEAVAYPYSIDCLEPIPLTPEILEKNGFEKDDGGEECWGCDAGWVIPGEYDECGKEKSWQVEILGEPNSFTGTIHSVHELQHALRLCGIEKEIIL